jgi:general secretion pathway protein M
MKLAAVQAHWDALAPRERRLVRGALALVAAALLWWLALAPALQTVRTADARHRELQGEFEHMQGLQAQARALQALPRLGYDEALRALQASITALGPRAQLSVLGERATVTLKGVPADLLAQWLAQARVNARALPTDARLTRQSTGTASWDGTVVLNLPPR